MPLPMQTTRTVAMREAPRGTIGSDLEVRTQPHRSQATSTWTIAHDFAFVPGGAEWVTKVLSHWCLPDSPLVYLAGDKNIASTLTPTGSTQLLPRSITEH